MKNVICVGTDSNYIVEPLSDERITNELGDYYEHCKEAYEALKLLEKYVNIDLDGSISDFSSLTERDISKLIGEMALDIWDKDMYEAYLKFHGNDISDKGVSAEW